MAPYYRDFYPPSRPRQAAGGIKARSRRGTFAESWWGRRWIEVLESFNIGARLGRGRTYARKGQAVDLAVTAGKVTAKVQGSRPRPYAVSIALKPIPAKDWRRLAAAVAGDLGSMARLAAGEMPETLEDTFRAAGVPLFPVQERPVPASDLIGEEAWPTQPFPIKPTPFSRQGLEKDDLTDIV